MFTIWGVDFGRENCLRPQFLCFELQVMIHQELLFTPADGSDVAASDKQSEGGGSWGWKSF